MLNLQDEPPGLDLFALVFGMLSREQRRRRRVWESGWVVDNVRQAPSTMEVAERMKRLSGLQRSRLLERVFGVVELLEKIKTKVGRRRPRG